MADVDGCFSNRGRVFKVIGKLRRTVSETKRYDEIRIRGGEHYPRYYEVPQGEVTGRRHTLGVDGCNALRRFRRQRAGKRLVGWPWYLVVMMKLS